MKNYFKFNLTGSKLFPVWLLFIFLFLIPYIFVQYKLQGLHDQNQIHEPQEVFNLLGSMLQWYGLMLLLVLVEYAIIFLIAKLSIEAVEFKEKSFVFVGKFSEFLLVLIPGFLLTIVTIGIYGPWFLTNIYKFFSKKSLHDSNSIEFKGKGGDLLLIILFTIIIPMIFIMVAVGIFTFFTRMKGSMEPSSPNPLSFFNAVIMMLIIFIIIIPYVYYFYRWIVNFKFKDYSIQWVTRFWNSVGKIALEIFISVITIGIYSPLATLKLYQYFAKRTIAKSETGIKKFGYDIEPGNDFLFIWGQLLLTIITLGIYYPWAYSKIGERILGKTFFEEKEIV